MSASQEMFAAGERRLRAEAEDRRKSVREAKAVISAAIDIVEASRRMVLPSPRRQIAWRRKAELAAAVSKYDRAIAAQAASDEAAAHDSQPLEDPLHGAEAPLVNPSGGDDSSPVDSSSTYAALRKSVEGGE